MRTSLCVIALASLCFVLAAAPATAVEPQPGPVDQPAEVTGTVSLVEPIVGSLDPLAGSVPMGPVDPCGDQTWGCSQDIPTSSPCFGGGYWWVHQNCTCSYYCSYYNCVTIYYFCVT